MLAAVWGQPRPPTGDSGLPPRCSAEKSNHNEYLKINTLSTEIKVKNSSIQNKFYRDLRFGLIHHLSSSLLIGNEDHLAVSFQYHVPHEIPSEAALLFIVQQHSLSDDVSLLYSFLCGSRLFFLSLHQNHF